MSNQDKTAMLSPAMQTRYEELHAKANHPYTDPACKGMDYDNRFDDPTVETIREGYPNAIRVEEYEQTFIVEGVDGFFQSAAEVDDYSELLRLIHRRKRAATAGASTQKGQNNE